MFCALSAAVRSTRYALMSSTICAARSPVIWSGCVPGNAAGASAMAKATASCDAVRTAHHLHRLKIFMHKLDRHRAFAYGRRDAFDRSGAHVSGGEYPGMTGFEQERRPRGSPMRRLRQSRSGTDE